MTPTIGRIVHYRLSEQDATAINKRRNDAAAYARAHRSPEVAPTPGSPGATGHVAHVGNPATAGDVCPAVIVRVFHPDAVNLQVLLDGTDTFWATSPHEGDGDGEWMWPPRV